MTSPALAPTGEKEKSDAAIRASDKTLPRLRYLHVVRVRRDGFIGFCKHIFSETFLGELGRILHHSEGQPIPLGYVKLPRTIALVNQLNTPREIFPKIGGGGHYGQHLRFFPRLRRSFLAEESKKTGTIKRKIKFWGRTFTTAFATAIRECDVTRLAVSFPLRSFFRVAARVGKHVLCEKPMAMSVSECDEMIAACEANHVTLGVAYYRRFYPIVLRMKQLLAAGEIGTLLMDIGSHRINLLLDMFGEVAEVKSFRDTVGYDYAAENIASVLLQFQSGMHGSLTCLFGTPIDPDRFEVIGTNGRMLAMVRQET